MIGIGIIGCGKIAQVRHLPEYENNKNVKLIGLFDMNQLRAFELAEQYNAKTYSTYKELLADPEIDAVSVCVANNVHAEIAIAALKAGKHVLCEKPMATTLEDSRLMVKQADESKKILMIGQNQRLTTAHKLAKKIIADGEIGSITAFRTMFGHGGPETWSVDGGASTWFFDPKRASMGVMADLGVHKTDLIQYLTGQDIVEVTAKMVTVDKKTTDGIPIGVDDNSICLYKLENGAIGSMMASWTFYGREDNSTVLYGTEGIMRIYDDDVYPIIIHKKSGECIRYEIEKMQTNNEPQTSSGVIDAFIASLIGDVSQLIDGKSILKTMEVVFAAIESAKKIKQ